MTPPNPNAPDQNPDDLPDPAQGNRVAHANGGNGKGANGNGRADGHTSPQGIGVLAGASGTAGPLGQNRLPPDLLSAAEGEDNGVSPGGAAARERVADATGAPDPEAAAGQDERAANAAAGDQAAAAAAKGEGKGSPPDVVVEAEAHAGGGGVDAGATRTPGCYTVVPYDAAQIRSHGLPEGAFYVTVRQDVALAVVPDDQAALCRDVSQVLEALRTLSPQRKDNVATYYARLGEMARVGLTGDWARPGLARTVLQSLRDEILRQEGSVVKTKYMSKLAWVAATVAVPALGVAALARLTERFEPAVRRMLPFEVPPTGLGLLNYVETTCGALLLAGAAVGAWLSFGAQEGFAFERLLILEEDYLGPKTRMGFAVAISLVLALLFHTKLVIVGVGEVSTADVFKTPVIALVIGLISGFGSKAVARLVSATFNKFIGAADKDEAPPPAATANVKVKVETPGDGAAPAAGGNAGAARGAGAATT